MERVERLTKQFCVIDVRRNFFINLSFKNFVSVMQQLAEVLENVGIRLNSFAPRRLPMSYMPLADPVCSRY